MGVSDDTLSKAENVVPIRLGLANAIASHYGVKLTDLLPPKVAEMTVAGNTATQAETSATGPLKGQSSVVTDIIEGITPEEVERIERRPALYAGRKYTIIATKIGQEMGSNFIVDHDDGLADAAGTVPGDTLRFQVFGNNMYIYRIHADGLLADIVHKDCQLQYGMNDAGSLRGKTFVIECRGKYKELETGFVDFPGKREWAVIWRLVQISDNLKIV